MATIVKFVWKMQIKSGIMKSGLDAMPLVPLDNLLKSFFRKVWDKNIRNFVNTTIHRTHVDAY